MIQVLQMVSDGDDCLARLGCTCGDPSLALYNCEDDQIIFCTRCGEITSRDRLLNESSISLSTANLIWLNVTNRAECPLVNVSIPAVVTFADPAGAVDGMTELPAVVTKISTDRCFLRLEESAQTEQLDRQREICLRAWEIPLAGETPATLEEVLRPHGPVGPAYYKVRLSLESPQRKSELESFFQSTCGLRFEWHVLLFADLENARHLRQLLRDCLPLARIEVTSNTVDFIRLFNERTPDLCLTPLLPELLQTVSQGSYQGNGSTPRVIVLISERTSSDISEALRWGADDILLFDCKQEDVRRAIQRCQRKGADDPSLSSLSGMRTWVKEQPIALVREGGTIVSVTEDDTVRMLCMASETHDTNISGHLKRLAAYTAAIAHEMRWPQERIARLATASKLHDVGKLGVPDEILRKTGALTEDERTRMQQHTRLGYHILHTSVSELMRLGSLIALRHHERFDGTGYPDGLAGGGFPIEAQIVSVADVFDALTTARAYKAPWSNEQAVNYMQEQAGRMFSPAIIEAFLRVLPEIEKNRLRFLDDFRDIWTERRKHPRHPVTPVPVSLEIAMPEQTFRPFRLNGHVCNLSLGGLKVMLNNISLDLFTLLISSRRYAKIYCLDPAWPAIHQTFCSVIWIDYYAVPDPTGCLMGLNFQKSTSSLNTCIRRLGNGVH